MDENNSTGLPPEIEVKPSGGRSLSCGTENLQQHAEDEWELLTETMIPKNAERATTEENQFSTEKEALSLGVLSDDHNEATLNESDIEVLIGKPLSNLELREMSIQTEIKSQTISRNALGRVASIGDVYDVTTDSFTGFSILNDQIPIDAITTVNQNRSPHFKHITSADLSEKFKQLNIEPELQASILADLLPIDGHAKYLAHEKKSSKSVEMSSIYTIETYHEEIQFGEQMGNIFSEDALELDVGTHVVIGITWGTKLITTLEKNEESGNSVDYDLKNKLTTLTVAMLGQAMPEDNEDGLSIKVFGDILPKISIAHTLLETATILQKSLKLLKITNKGKGKPIVYALLPLPALKEYVHCSIEEKIFIPLCPNIINSITSLFEHVGSLQLKINDLIKTFEENSICIPVELVRQLSDYKRKLSSEVSTLKAKLKTLVPAIRGEDNLAKTMDEMLATLNGESLQAEINDWLDTQVIWSKKIMFVEELKKKNVSYEGIKSNFDISQTKNSENLFHIFFHGVDPQLTDFNFWNENVNFFLTLIDTLPHDQFVIIDLDVCPQLSLKGFEKQIRICDIQDGIIKDPDVYGTNISAEVKCFVKGHKYEKSERPYRRVDLQLKCPGALTGPCEDEDFKWHCRHCDEIISYGFDKYFYCGCGKASFDTFSFKCMSEKHNTGFMRFHINDLKVLLQAIPPMDELNILILGATGVGKSTWINAFINYLVFPSLEEATHGKLLSVTPSWFQMTDENDKVHNIRTGKDDKNEVLLPGQSGTQDAKAHLFPVGNTLIRLIDTPGIGDVRGVQQDKENLAKILSYLENVKELHGICILLMPNESKLHVLFEFCIQELLTHLHRDAARNIAFCFTHSRSTFYKPGNSRVPLKELLKQKNININLNKDTMYCVDNESFRFLSAVNQGVQFNEEIKRAFSESWNISVQETNRLIAHFKSLQPHSIVDTISLNDARKNVICLTQTIADISNIIQENVSRVNWKREMLLTSDERLSELVKHLYIEVVHLEPEDLPFPRTICTNSGCVHYYPIGDGSSHSIEYKTVCHDHCLLKDVPVDIVGDRRIMGCAAMNGGKSLTCLNCGCMWDQHMHITYIQRKVMEKITVQEVEDEMSEKKTENEQIEEFLEMTESYIKEQENEQQQLIEASVRFGHYLSKNAMLVYNDVMVRYIEHLIKREEDKAATTKNFDLVLRLKKMQETYRAEEKALKDAMQRPKTRGLTFEQFQKLLQELYRLRHNGRQLKKIFEQASKAKVESSVSNYETFYSPQSYVSGIKRGCQNFAHHGRFPACNQPTKSRNENYTRRSREEPTPPVVRERRSAFQWVKKWVF